MPTEDHRELCRRHLRLVLEAGYNPMKFFANDYKKYFYLAELYSLIDLSTVRCNFVVLCLHASTALRGALTCAALCAQL